MKPDPSAAPPEPIGVETDLRQRAEAAMHAQPRPAAASAAHETLKLLHELQVHQIELEMQNAELRAAQMQAQANLERYTELYDFALTSYFTLNRQGVISQLNLAGAALLQADRKTLCGQRFSASLEAADRRAFAAFLDRLWTCEVPQRCEVRVNVAGQASRTAEIQARCNDDGLSCQLMATDISERKQADEQLRKLLLAVEQSPHAVVITDLDGRVEYANAACASSSGYALAEIVGSNQRLQQSGQTPRASYDSLWCALTRGETWRGEFINRRKDGTIYTELASISPVRQADGRVSHYLGIKEDITARKKYGAFQAFLAQAGASSAAEPFFDDVARQLAEVLDSSYVCIGRLEGDGLGVRTMAIWNDGHFEDKLSFALDGWPCGAVVSKGACCIPTGVCQVFPHDQVLQDLKAVSCVGAPLTDHSGSPIGLIAVISRRPLADPAFAASILKLVTVRAGGELERMLNEERLESQVSERTAHLADANRLLAANDQRLSTMLAMSQMANTLDERQLLQMGIEAAVAQTGSQVGYLLFVDDDQQTLALCVWSESMQRPCTATGNGRCPVAAGGVWADSIRSQRPVIHNDLQAMAGCSGEPGGHTELERQLVVPLVENGRVRLLMGVGNKAIDYVEADVRELRLIGSDLWMIVMRRRTEVALVAARDAAETANRAKSDFLANMSHEIRTPMNGILGMVHLLRREGATPKQTGRLDTIHRSGQHLLSVIDAILDISKIEAGKLVLEDAPVHIGAIVEDVKFMLLDRAKAKGITLSIDIAPIPPRLRGDTTRLQQALINYATNAIKFSDKGTVTLRIRCAEEDATSVLLHLEVQDTGIGIDPDAQARLFTNFEQADNTISRRFGGSGLGLAITRRLAALMGGSTGFQSTAGVGSVFWFTARLRKDLAAAALTVDASVSQSAEQVLLRDFAASRILLVEDEPVNLQMAQLLLEEAGLTVETAEDGLSAVTLAARNSYALILMDIQLPNLDGLEATRLIRASAIGQKVPIVALTANAFAQDRQRCLAAGMNDYLCKPIAAEHLFAMVLKWLALGRR